MVAAQEVQAHQRAIRANTAEVASALQDLFGQKVTAVIAGVQDSRAIGKWSRGERTPHPEAERRLRETLRIADFLLQEEPPEIVRAWFVGLNPILDDRPPALVVAEDPGQVMSAARSFLATG
jgi:hypothetical protein